MTMLPPLSEGDIWGALLRNFLYVSHNADGSLKSVPWTVQAGSSYTLVEADANTVIVFTSDSDVTLTVPDDASSNLPDACTIIVVQFGDGTVTAVGGSDDVTLNAPSTTSTNQQFSQMSIDKLPKVPFGASQFLIGGDTQ